MKNDRMIWLCVFALMLYLIIVTLGQQPEVVTVVEIVGEHEVILSNGRSMLVENAYNEAFEVGSTLIFK